MPAGRPPKPAQLRVISGTARPDRAETAPPPLPPDEILVSVPPPPEWMLNPHAVIEWLRIAPILVRNKLLTEGNLTALGQYCAVHGSLVDEYLERRLPTASSIGQFRALAVEFGLTPMSQGKVRMGAAAGAPAGNKFGNNAKPVKQA